VGGTGCQGSAKIGEVMSGYNDLVSLVPTWRVEFYMADVVPVEVPASRLAPPRIKPARVCEGGARCSGGPVIRAPGTLQV
jgi:hypothetical protein